MIRQRGLPFCRWPQQDQDLLNIGMLRSSRRTKRRSPCSLSTDTKNGIVADTCISLGWLGGHGLFDTTAAPSKRWPAVVIEQIISEMISNGYSIATLHSRVGRLKRCINIMEPHAALNHFNEILRKLERPKPAFDPIIWRVTSRDLQAYGVEMMQQAENSIDIAEIDRADLHRTGLQVALIASRPWRKRPFSNLELWKHVTNVSGE
jgi:hypothetical protein